MDADRRRSDLVPFAFSRLIFFLCRPCFPWFEPVRSGTFLGIVLLLACATGASADEAAELARIREQTLAEFTLSDVAKDSAFLQAHVGLLDQEAAGLLRGGEYWKTWTSAEQPDISMGTTGFSPADAAGDGLCDSGEQVLSQQRGPRGD